MTTKEMKQTILSKNAASPSGQVSPGIYLQSIGYKYVKMLNTWDTTTVEYEPIEDFYNWYIN